MCAHNDKKTFRNKKLLFGFNISGRRVIIGRFDGPKNLNMTNIQC